MKKHTLSHTHTNTQLARLKYILNISNPNPYHLLHLKSAVIHPNHPPIKFKSDSNQIQITFNPHNTAYDTHANKQKETNENIHQI